MRIGLNPQKDKIKELDAYNHQVVIPVYIPNEEEYFKDSFTILKFCLESLLNTTHPGTYFTIVDNGSCEKVASYLDSLHSEKKIHELIHTHNIGKVNAVFKGISGHSFPLITITDADVLFLPHWQQETYAVFSSFPKTGFVSLTPIPKLLKHNTQNLIFENLFSKRMQFEKPKNPSALKYFAESIGNPDFYQEVHLNNILTIMGEHTNAVVGGGHFVGTYRGNIFENLDKRYTPYKLGGKSVREFLDLPVLKKGYWRLTTESNQAYHMGNVVEPWMLETIQKQKNVTIEMIEFPTLTTIKNNQFSKWFKNVFFSKILNNKLFWNRFLQAKGLSREEAKMY